MKGHAVRCVSAALLSASLLLVSAGCGDDDDETTTAASDRTSTTEAPSTTAATGSRPGTPGGATVAVKAVDFAFEGVPATVAPGTKFTLTNESKVELHEMVATKLPDGETRSAAELLRLPEEEQAKLASGPPAAVLLSPPGGGPVINAVGDGSLQAPGRYLLICAIPTGANPGEYLEKARQSQDGPPNVAGGPPHFVNGMYAEIEVA